jgi:glycosyltransferase involved in cell wall biosynthesis
MRAVSSPAKHKGMSSVAVVHDYLTQFGGAERVALVMSDCFPEAPVYTSIYGEHDTFSEFRDRDVRTTSLQRYVPPRHFRLAGPLYGRAFSKLDLSAYDNLLISSSGFAHHVQHHNAYVYCHTPPRFIYELPAYFGKSWRVGATSAFLPWLRRRDQEAAQRHHRYVANSALSARRISALYGKDVGVIHPPLRTDHLPEQPAPMPQEPRALIVARLQPYKRFDLAIAACARAGIPLTIAGTGPDAARLKSLATGDVRFLGRVEDAALPELFRTHSVVLAPGIEDFGMAPIEANYSGRPVLARAAGGALETVEHGRTGFLVDSDDVAVWADMIDQVIRASWQPHELQASTAPFRVEEFRHKIHRWIERDDVPGSELISSSIIDVR